MHTRAAFVSGLALLAGCCPHLPPPHHAAPIPGPCPADTGCRGAVMTMPPTFEKVDDPAIKARILNPYVMGVPGKGELCAGEAWRVKSPVTVYRLQQKAPDLADPKSIGSWWSFSPPEGSPEQFWREYDVCPDWNNLSHLLVCQLKVGAVIAVGVGQSATCGTAPTQSCLPASSRIQVNTFDPNTKENVIEGCSFGDYVFAPSASMPGPSAPPL